MRGFGERGDGRMVGDGGFGGLVGGAERFVVQGEG